MPPPLPPGAGDPAEAFWTDNPTKAYSSQDLGRILRDRIWQPGSRTVPAGLPDSESRVFRSRVLRLQSKLGLRPGVLSTTGGKLALAGGAGTLLLGGIAVYQIISNWDGEQHVEYLMLNRAELGGQRVLVPNATTYPIGEFWRARPSTVSDGRYFGWKRVSDASPGVTGEQPGWVFNYYVDFWQTANPTGWVTMYGPGYEQTPGGTGTHYFAFPSADWCLTNTTNLSNCLSPDGSLAFNSGTMKGSTAFAQQMALAIHQTVGSLDGVRNPLRIRGDLEWNLAGHPGASTWCNRAASPGVSCGLAYVPEYVWERAAPDVSEQAPGAVESSSSHTVTNPGSAAQRQAVRDDSTPCARRILNYLIDPVAYPLAPGFCPAPAQDAEKTSDDGAEDPVAPPQQEPPFEPFALPRPLLHETAAQYRARLRQRGWLGTAIIETEGTPFPGVGPLWMTGVQTGTGVPTIPLYEQSPVPALAPGVEQARLPWPTNAPTVGKTTTIVIRQQPETDPATGEPVPLPTLPPDGEPDPEDCNCPPVNFEPLKTGATEKFPFGLFTWLAGFWEGIGADGEAPSFVVKAPWNASVTWTLSFESATAYKGTTDTIVKLVVVLASVWWLATGMLGIGKGDRVSGDD